MSNKPRIYGFCKAGCQWETVHKDDFLNSASIVKIPKNADGTFTLDPERKYRIVSGITDGRWDFSIDISVSHSGDSILYTIPVEGLEHEEFSKSVNFRYLGTSYDAEIGTYIFYEIDGTRRSSFLFYHKTEVKSVSITLENATEVYLYNEDAEILGMSAYDIAVANGYNGTEEEWIELLTKTFPYDKYSLPIVYFDGDISGMNKDNAVTLNYRYGDRSGTCTLKWQGTSSIAYPKKNYTVKFDNAFEAVAGWGEQKKYCLKADWIDFSHCRNVVSAKLWGDVVRSRTTSDLVTRLSALPNCGAIDGFPCFVVINGEWEGIYNFNIPKEGWMMGMGSGSKEAILCAEGSSNTSPELFFSEATIGTNFGLEYSSDGWTESDIQTSLNRLISAVKNSDGSDIDTTISQYLDIDSAIDYMVFTTLLNHWDGICKNYILATYDGVKWFFSAYDMDNVFGARFESGFHLATYDTNIRTHKLFNLLYSYKIDEVLARYKELVNGVLAKSEIDFKFTEYARHIPLPAYVADAELWATVPNSAVNNIDQAMNWYGERVKWCDEVFGADMENAFGTKGLKYDGVVCRGIGTCIEPNVKMADYRAGTPIQYIGSSVFAGETALETIILSKNVKEIYNEAFKGCTSLKEVVFPSTIVQMMNRVFQNCTSLKTVTLPSMTYMGGEVFMGCTSLTKVVLPADMPKLQWSVFQNCTSLKDIFYGGTMAQWEALEKDATWNTNTGTYTVHCTDGDIAKS